jgi:hypothetical protein
MYYTAYILVQLIILLAFSFVFLVRSVTKQFVLNNTATPHSSFNDVTRRAEVEETEFGV